jgi:hypothetical protein
MEGWRFGACTERMGRKKAPCGVQDLFAASPAIDAGVPLTSRRISEPVMNLLRFAVIRGNVLLPMPEVERHVYDELAQVIERLRGKWVRGKGHVFPYIPTASISAVLATGLMPADNPHAYFPTPAELASDLVKSVDGEWWPRGVSKSSMRVLEPSAGWGSIADAMRQRWPLCEITCCEIDPLNVAALRAKGYEVNACDFLSWRPNEPFDVVVGNPPFSVDGDVMAWLTHFRHAWSMLAEGGCIGWIVPGGTWLKSPSRQFLEFREWLLDIGAVMTSHPAESFKDSGTTIPTMDIVAVKYGETIQDPDQSREGVSMSDDAQLVMIYVDNDRPMHERRAACGDDPAKIDAFIEDAIVFANKEHETGGIARTSKLKAELRALWEVW